MAQIVNNGLPRTQGRPPVYPWDEWCDGKARRLFRGEDFFSHPKSFRVLVHRTAKGRGLKAHTHIEDDNTFIVEFYDPADK